MTILRKKSNIFEISLKTKVIFGINSLEKIGSEVKVFGKRGLLVTTSKYLIKSGLAAKINEELKRVKIKCYITSKVSPNPKTKEINNIYRIFWNKPIDFVIGLGGGSSIDAAKAIAVLLGHNKNNIEEYLIKDKEPSSLTLPIIAIPTTAGSGSEVTAGAILTDVKRKLKAGIRGKAIIPSLAILDPMLTLSVPYNITKFTGFDVFAHALESFLSKKSNPFSDLLAIKSMKIVINTLLILLKNLDSIELRSKMLFASLIAGINLIDVGTCLPHRLQYPMGAFTDMPHGLGLAIIYPEWLRKIKMAKLRKIEALRDIFKQPINDPIQEIDNFLDKLQINDNLKSKYYIPSDMKLLCSKIKGNLDNDPIYLEGIVEEIYTSLINKGVLSCKH